LSPQTDVGRSISTKLGMIIEEFRAIIAPLFLGSRPSVVSLKKILRKMPPPRYCL